MDKKREILLLAAVFLILAGVHSALGFQAIKSFSPTYDEPVHLTAGAVYWKTGNYKFNGAGHTPFSEMWAALPLIFMKPDLPVLSPYWIHQRWTALDQYHFADLFFYRNRVPWEQLLTSGRVMILLLSLILGGLMGWAGWKIGGGKAALIALLFWSLSPTLLAHATLISTDLSFALFFFLFFFSLTLPPAVPSRILTGAALGLCMASKFFFIILGPCLAALFLWNWRRLHFNKSFFLLGLLSLGTAVGVLALVYKISSFGMFFVGIDNFLSLAGRGRSSFLMGEYGTTGWITYFPIVFLTKTPIPILIAFLLGVLRVRSKKMTWPPEFWIPPLVFFIFVSFAKVQIGQRYILAVYPFVLLIGAAGLASLQGRSRFILLPLLGWLVFSTVHTTPHFLSYFNEFIGGPKNGYKVLTDSNVDWGQGLGFLSEALSQEDKEKGIFLSYFGVADPHAYGIRYIDIGSDSIAGHEDDYNMGTLSPTKFAVSATNLQGTYYADPQFFSWLKEMRPIQRVAHSIFIYDLSGHPQLLSQLHHLRRSES